MRIELTEPAAAAVRRGHPWIYREGLARAPRSLSSGEPVEVADASGRVLGHGLWDASSPLAVRVYDPNRPVTPHSLADKIDSAIALRQAMFEGSSRGDAALTAYRLCNGEGDRVPGLVLDRYGNVAILRTDGDAIATWVDRLVPSLAKSLGRVGVTTLATRLDDGDKTLRTLAGPAAPDKVVVEEHGMAMEVDLAKGQKTGAFLDQRENRKLVRELARGRRRVLNLFSYAGGFSIAAALGGVERVVSVDSAAAAHASAQRSFRANGLDVAAHEFVTADVFAFLEAAKSRGARFDLIVCDPPSFAPNERSRKRALGAYRRLHGAVSGVLERGGLLCAASCSSHVGMDEFLSTLDDAAVLGHLRVLSTLGLPPDHPTTAAFWEGRYLKFVVMG